MPVGSGMDGFRKELQMTSTDRRVRVRSAESRRAMVVLYGSDRNRCTMNTRTLPTCVLAPHHRPSTHLSAVERQMMAVRMLIRMMVYG